MNLLNLTTMNDYEKRQRSREMDARHPKQPIKNAQKSVPGQQIGLYSDNEAKDVCQMTRTLNNPGENSQSDRG